MSGKEDSASASESVRSIITKVAVFCTAIIFLLPPAFFGTPGTGLDPSWQVALHYAFEKKLVFGTEFLFTYGPLGILTARLPFLSSYHVLLINDLLIFLLVTLMLGHAVKNTKRLGDMICLIASCFLIGSAKSFSHDLVIFLFIIMLGLLFYSCHRKTTLPVFLAVLLAIEISLIKQNLGIASILCIFGTGAFFFFVENQKLRALSIVLAFVVSLILASYVFPFDIVPYFYGGFEISKGYNDGMMIFEEQRYPVLYTSLVYLALLLSLALHTSLRKNQGVMLFCGAMLTGFVFLVFKQSFIRADGHVDTFLYYFPACVTLLVFAYRGALYAHSLTIALTTASFSSYMLGLLPGPAAISSKLASFETYLTEAQAGPGEAGIGSSVEPRAIDAFLPAIGTDTVDIVPWDIAYLYLHQRNYTPRPVMQSYTSYTEYLDTMNANFIHSDRAPEYYIYEAHCADHRYCFWDDSHMKIAMLDSYKTIDEAPYALLLKKRKKGTPARKLSLHSTVMSSPGSWITVPKMSDTLLYARIDTSYTTSGKLRSIFFQSPDISVVFRGKGFKQGPFRAVKPIMEGGVLINKLIMSTEDAQHFFNEEPESLPDIKRFRLKVSPKGMLSERIRVQFYTLSED